MEPMQPERKRRERIHSHSNAERVRLYTPNGNRSNRGADMHMTKYIHGNDGPQQGLTLCRFVLPLRSFDNIGIVNPVRIIDGKEYQQYMSAIQTTMNSLQKCDKNRLYTYYGSLEHPVYGVERIDVASCDTADKIVVMAIIDTNIIEASNVIVKTKAKINNLMHKEEEKTKLTQEQLENVIKCAAIGLLYEASCGAFDCNSDGDPHPWSSYQPKEEETNNADTVGNVYKITTNGKKKVAVKTLRDYNNGCKKSGYRFVANTNLIGGYFVDDSTGDCFEWYPASMPTVEKKNRSHAMIESVIRGVLSESEVEIPDLINILGNAQQFCIISAEKTEMNEDEKRDANAKMNRILRGLGCKAVIQNGHWDVDEKSYAIIGLSDWQCSKISREFKQEAYILANRDETSSCGYNFKLFKDVNNDGQYTLVEQSNEITTDESVFKQFGGWSEIAGFKYAIMF